MDISVVLTTYNRPGSLALVLEGYLRQTQFDFEMVIADDGSGDETKDVIDAFRERAPFPIIHAWREHDGFRAAAVRNMGIKRASTGYLIFTDGDCIPCRDLVERHRKSRREGSFVLGGYVRLTEEYSRSLTPEKVAEGEFANQLMPKRRAKLWYHHMNSYFYNLTGSKDRPRIAGMNFSVWKADVIAVNGFDENYVGWGREDSDMRTRLRRYGLRGKSIWPYCLIYHIHHPPDPSKGDGRQNAAYYYTASKRPRCENGLVKERP
jgi:glycosyltransferase involved in cell wall biosynthesis